MLLGLILKQHKLQGTTFVDGGAFKFIIHRCYLRRFRGTSQVFNKIKLPRAPFILKIHSIQLLGAVAAQPSFKSHSFNLGWLNRQLIAYDKRRRCEQNLFHVFERQFSRNIFSAIFHEILISRFHRSRGTACEMRVGMNNVFARKHGRQILVSFILKCSTVSMVLSKHS